ncbi:Glycine-zipper containing OmpA-like membrane domain-containing protein [Gemmobacter aquatilis]|uniref:17 kDa surface antigen n=1 Tax=Gemmobacter aquatilis TaxID=933059 RepID=A0A1H8J051_9RHOB|nr:YMGG-like glycine zipper-containing protein [Gemmobacter aquatilis]SEN74253.1 Glycine-zipper containing OmpA-like membrane domain-containing protein [Gemmobacter aquatilis]
MSFVRNLVCAVPLVALLAACQTGNPNTTTGALTGAAIGAMVTSDGDKLKGAAAGAALGALAGSTIPPERKQCIYTYPDGRQYRADCP